MVLAYLGHRKDISELAKPETGITWFPDESYAEFSYKQLNAGLCEAVYQLVKDCPLRTTEIAQSALVGSYPGEEWVMRKPHVAKGTAVTGDSYWNGRADHDNVVAIVDHYKCPDEYAVSEMEEVAILNAAECFGLKDRVVSLRVVVNMDTFLKGESPESLCLDGSDFSDSAAEEKGETLDIFEPGMRNLFDVERNVVDTILVGEL